MKRSLNAVQFKQKYVCSNFNLVYIKSNISWSKSTLHYLSLPKLLESDVEFFWSWSSDHRLWQQDVPRFQGRIRLRWKSAPISQ